MKIDFKSLLPDPDEKGGSKLDPEVVLNELAESITDRYHGRILGVFASTSEVIEKDKPKLSYTFYLIFTRHDNYSYPLFTAQCKNSDGSYPIIVNSHYGPPIEHGIITDEDKFRNEIMLILKEEKTRNIILAMY